jgi:Family of unknown function (DUF6011)
VLHTAAGDAGRPFPDSAFVHASQAMTDFSDLNDSLADLLDAPVVVERKAPPATYAKPETYFDSCTKCHGTGQTRWGTCFRCQGNGGKTFKTSPEARAKTRQNRADRKQRNADEACEAFKIAHPDVYAWLLANVERFEFATNMWNALRTYGDLTANQLAACERCVARDKQRAAERQGRVENAPTVDVTRIEKAFATAREKANRPGARGIWVHPLRLKSGEHDLRFTEGSAGSQWQGMIFVKTADGRKLGSVKDGKFTRRFECTDSEEAAVIDACGDPLKAAIAYGKAWSVCAVCGRELTNDGSIERGIGPICASKYGWGAE